MQDAHAWETRAQCDAFGGFLGVFGLVTSQGEECAKADDLEACRRHCLANGSAARSASCAHFVRACEVTSVMGCVLQDRNLERTPYK